MNTVTALSVAAIVTIFATVGGLLFMRGESSHGATRHVIDGDLVVKEHGNPAVEMHYNPAVEMHYNPALKTHGTPVVKIYDNPAMKAHGNPAMKSHTLDAALEYYQQTDLAHFAKQHRKELELARKDRKRECGSIVSVSKIDCELCVLFVVGLTGFVNQGWTQDDVATFSTEVCIDLNIQDERVCRAVIQEFKAEVFGVAMGLAYTPKEVCSYALATDCGAPYNPGAMWNVTFPNITKPPVKPPSPPKTGAPQLRVLHLTDLHMDAEYLAGTNAECGEPLCCRDNDGSPAPGVAGAGKYGDYRNCDSAPVTVESLFQHLSTMKDEFDHVLFTGDIPAHNVWNQSRSNQVGAMNHFTSLVLKYLPGKKIYNTLGNHESAPVDSFPPPYITGNNSETWLYEATAKNWLTWLPSETESTIKKAGYYTTKPFPGLRIISLNMNMCDAGNWWLFINATDPAGMLQWFISELQDAETMGDKVHVIGHIFPGCNCCLKPWSWNYYKIMNRYENTIAEQFFGHTHSMLYEVFYDEKTFVRPLGVAYMPGSITPYSFLNPGFRIYEIDGNYPDSSWRVQDYTNYYLNLTHANMYGEVIWKKEYSAKAAYGMPSLFPKDWSDLIYRMKADDNLFQTFCRHTSKSAPNSCDTCTGDCKKNLLCGLKTGRNGDPDICNDL